MNLVLSVVIGYLFGSIPSGALVARSAGGPDLRRVGSGRTGATNVLRTLGKKAAAVVFIADFVKGALAVGLVHLLTGGDEVSQAAAAALAVVGHVYSPFMGFKGGRGVTTGLGGLLALAPAAGAAALVFGSVAIVLTRYVSLGSIVGAVVGALGVILLVTAHLEPAPYAVYAVAVAAFIVVAHHDNIGRLFSGTERRLGERV
ncbi:MAG: glycerol-3-phosphate 1-O-acyltransferase PlsY [Chloroflexi bacterium]|nr:glycerol-3-phosphate 1-O-acyltransferase PlsY [Chloroflexota bacterium]